MSGIKERIASRRRGTASTELGPVPENGRDPHEGGSPAPVAPASQAPGPSAAPASSAAPGPSAAAPTTPPPAPPPTAEPNFIARSRMRRRVRYLRQLREIQLRDLGGFVLELHRFGRERPDLVQAKVAWSAQTDAELRALERALGEDHPMRELREPGIGGACETCGAVHGSQDRFCATCGEPLSGDQAADDTPLDPGHPGGAR